MFKVLWIKFRWIVWCWLTDLGYWLAGPSFRLVRINRLGWSGWLYPFRWLAKTCWFVADRVFAVDDKDFMLAFPYDDDGETFDFEGQE